MSDPSTSSTLQATPGPFWRDRGFWVQFTAQSALFLFFGGIDLASSTAVDNGSDAGVTGLLLAVGYTVTFVGLLVQRSRPEPGLVTVVLGLVVAGAALSEFYVLAAGVVGYEAWFISGYVRRRRRVWLTALLTGAVTGAVLTVLAPELRLGWGGRMTRDELYGGSPTSTRELLVVSVGLTVFIVVSVALCWQLGLGVRRQHERMENLAARAELAAVAERNRIAREMHDIVAHSLTAVIAQADGGRYAGRKDPDKAIETLETIAATAREALAQMRQLLSVLREDASRDTGSAPGVSGVPGLVDDARRSGLEVSLDIRGDAHEVPATVGLTVYRTVQESLTNVLKHAGKVRTRVVLDWSRAGSLLISVDNAPGTAGDALVDPTSAAGGAGGQGLLGLKERARVHGGSASWGPSEVFAGGWRVAVTLAA
ncbi:sensor histidine kinase [uncultured Corynebacterium sp.]|uniref:sensor histidine kinase n=1 Tax=uncultured Corynebacterium sp. TaxID=159447 RepID=UPI0025CD8E39|nr:histidine kinase [uncultured Corynebacterium sp.]